MCFVQFLGNESPFQIIVAIVAFGTALYTFYKSFLERAKLSLYPGDRLGLVILTGGSSRFHLRTRLAITRSKQVRSIAWRPKLLLTQFGKHTLDFVYPSARFVMRLIAWRPHRC
jgi:hypothetical protein